MTRLDAKTTAKPCTKNASKPVGDTEVVVIPSSTSTTDMWALLDLTKGAVKVQGPD